MGGGGSSSFLSVEPWEGTHHRGKLGTSREEEDDDYRRKILLLTSVVVAGSMGWEAVGGHLTVNVFWT